jgi:hypothetical protein
MLARLPREWRYVPIDGQRLRQLRAERGLSQERLAWKADLDVTTIRRLECRPHPWCRAWTMDLLAAALETEPLSLTRPDEPQKPASSAAHQPGSYVTPIGIAKSRRYGHVS